jgi:AcrR family transcriptional regulator
MYSLHDPYVKSTRPYESPTRREHAELTRQRILDALIELMVDERPATISIPAVARRANVSVRTVYHHFATKEALFDALPEAARQRTGGVDLPEPQSPRELADGMRVAYDYLERNAALFNAVRVSEVDARVRGGIDRRNAARIEQALKPVTDRLDDEAGLRLCAVIGALASNDTYRTLTRRFGLSQDEAAEAVGWAITTLTDRAKRTGRVGDNE